MLVAWLAARALLHIAFACPHIATACDSLGTGPAATAMAHRRIAASTASGPPRYDVFISHASKDKEAVARPLAVALTALGFAVWFDEDRLDVGASLRARIDAGLSESRYAVVVFSRAFFEETWTRRELDGLFARELAENSQIILPLWHEVDAAFMATKAPMLADRLALRSDLGIPHLADRLARRL